MFHEGREPILTREAENRGDLLRGPVGRTQHEVRVRDDNLIMRPGAKGARRITLPKRLCLGCLLEYFSRMSEVEFHGDAVQRLPGGGT